MSWGLFDLLGLYWWHYACCLLIRMFWRINYFMRDSFDASNFFNFWATIVFWCDCFKLCCWADELLFAVGWSSTCAASLHLDSKGRSGQVQCYISFSLIARVHFTHLTPCLSCSLHPSLNLWCQPNQTTRHLPQHPLHPTTHSKHISTLPNPLQQRLHPFFQQNNGYNHHPNQRHHPINNRPIIIETNPPTVPTTATPKHPPTVPLPPIVTATNDARGTLPTPIPNWVSMTFSAVIWKIPI